MELNVNSFKDVDINFLENILKELPSNIFFKDRECKYVFMTHYWKHLKIDENDPNWSIKGKTDLEIRKDKENGKKAYEMDKQIIETGKGVTYTIRFEQDGVVEYLELIKNPVFDKEKNVIGIAGLINDVTKKVLQEQQLEVLVRKDQMTNLYNRIYLDYWMKNINNENLYPISIVMADCNNLKKINDKYGHLIGDEYIKKSASILNIVLPDRSVIFRLGGDEFLALIPNTNEEQTKTYIKEMNSVCRKIKIQDINPSIAFGYEIINNYQTDFMKFIDIADKMMYENKKEIHENLLIKKSSATNE